MIRSIILFKPRDVIKTRHVLIPWMTARLLKPGTPVDEDGAVSNDGDAVGLLLYNGDVGETVVVDGVANINAEVIYAGYIDITAAEASCGLTYADELKAALTELTFVKNGDEPATLPDPTTEGDVLTVGRVADSSVVILPQQTVECDESWYFPTGGTPEVFEDGMKVCITVNGESVVSTVSVSSGGLVHIPFPPVEEGGLAYEEVDGWSFWDDGYYEGEPITISVTGTKLGWEAESVGGAYDAILSLYHDNNSASGTVVTIEKGDYDSLVEILDSKRTPVLFVKTWDELTHLYANTSVTAVYTYNSEYIDFRVAMPGAVQFDFITLKWKPNNTFVIA